MGSLDFARLIGTFHKVIVLLRIIESMRIKNACRDIINTEHDKNNKVFIYKYTD